MAAKEGIDINVTGQVAFSNGPFVNGAAMRIAPIEISFRNAFVDQLQGLQSGPRASLRTVLLYLPGESRCSRTFLMFLPFSHRQQPLVGLLDTCSTPALRFRLHTLLRYWGKPDWASVVWALDIDPPPADHLFCSSQFSTEQDADAPVSDCVAKCSSESGYCKNWFQIRAAAAVPCALWAFLSHWHSTLRKL
jgi:hypothetical protein